MPVDLSLGDFIRDNALRHGDVPAYSAADRALTHRELLTRATSLASAPARAGLRRQDRIALYGRNGVAFGEVPAAGRLLPTGKVDRRRPRAEYAAQVRG